MVVEHGGYAIEAEPVKLVLFNPPAEVTEEVAEYLPLVVVE